ncbi:hypothetical protein BCR33DRAFT_847065 [Rhizoclosmatium globosum]|uniref:PLC-like phosphodiesterase n=1 Tax=Rhizoclosmatium globosum TaxID=329046 RepID=A0A1Y2CS05_9FUNG|nr:hypothetical protein BCR33DRAFT_847065 [Rhizoclosmatium globosum]|eukprot:ORY49781.1 hypothetical protein BCR33DRAFT_847065 [Rhizoclosmatium globosum]
MVLDTANWMSTQTRKYLHTIAIPATHHSALRNIACGNLTICQNMSLSDQLESGVRALDLRWTYGIVGSPLMLSHTLQIILIDAGYDGDNPTEETGKEFFKVWDQYLGLDMLMTSDQSRSLTIGELCRINKRVGLLNNPLGNGNSPHTLIRSVNHVQNWAISKCAPKRDARELTLLACQTTPTAGVQIGNFLIPSVFGVPLIPGTIFHDAKLYDCDSTQQRQIFEGYYCPPFHPQNAIKEMDEWSNDINKGFGGAYVSLEPIWTSNACEGCTGIRVWRSKNAQSGYTDMAKGTGGDYRYIEVTRSPGPKIVEIRLWRTSRGSKPSVSGYKYCDDLNQGRGGDDLYSDWEPPHHPKKSDWDVPHKPKKSDVKKADAGPVKPPKKTDDGKVKEPKKSHGPKPPKKSDAKPPKKPDAKPSKKADDDGDSHEKPPKKSDEKENHPHPKKTGSHKN